MKTARDFILRLYSDTAFADQMQDRLLAAGASDIAVVLSAAARELGCEVTPEQLRDRSHRNEDLSDAQLSHVAGGTGELFAWLLGA